MSSPLSIERHNQLIAKYFVPYMGDYSGVGSELSSILDRLDVNRALSVEDKQWIRDKGMFDLCEFVRKLEETGEADFKMLRAKIEGQEKRNIRRKLWQKYDIYHVEVHHLYPMKKILLKLEKGDRLSEKNVLWLSTNGYFFKYPGIKRKFHINEAMWYRRFFEKDNDPWQAVNASSHYRKANLPTEALKVLSKIEVTSQRNKHLKSALCTTKGACKRDLHQFDDAIQLAESALSFDPDSFHPCTLLGVVYYEKGNYSLGDEWFAEAVKRGANIDDVDHELHSIFMRANKAKQEELKGYLLSVDSVRYGWVNKPSRGKKGNGKTAHNRSINFENRDLG
ncbi:MAG: tetratricopeptide repeat protein [Desulfobaccales bacterium]